MLIAPLLPIDLVVNHIDIGFRKIREIAFYSLGIIIASYLQKNRWLRYFIIWCVASCWINLFSPPSSYTILTNIFSALVIYIGITKLLEMGFLKANILLRGVCLVILLQCAWMIMQMFGVDPFFKTIDWDINKGKMPLVGWAGNGALLGVFLSSTSFLFLEYFKVKRIPILFFIALGFSLLLKNATCAIAFSAGGLFYLLNKYKFKARYVLGGILILLSLLGFFLYIKPPNFDRFYIWNRIFHKWITLKPFMGHGLGTFSRISIQDHTHTSWFELHNDYLEMWLDVGLIGLTLFTGFIISKFIAFFKSTRTNLQICLASGLVAYLVSAMFLFPMRIVQTGFFALLLLGVLEHEYNLPKVQS